MLDYDKPTVIGYRAHQTRSTTVKGNTGINAAARSGSLQSEKKFTGGTNTKAAQSTDGQRLTKIDRENEVAPPPKIDLSVGKAIAKARSEKNPPLKQAELAQKVNEKPSVINGTSTSFDQTNI
jgi:putative transcription factor